MATFGDRLRFAITNYAGGNFSYKSFAGLVDIPYRSLQNYILNKRNPNIEALEKFHNNGVNIRWLITGEGEPYNHLELRRNLLDKIFLSCLDDILKKCLSEDSNLFDYDERVRIVSFIMQKNYLDTGVCIRTLLDGGFLGRFENVENLYNNGELSEVKDSEPSTPAEMWLALAKLKETQKGNRTPPWPLELNDE